MHDPIIPAGLMIVGGIIILLGVVLFAYQRMVPRPLDPVLIQQLEHQRKVILDATVTPEPTAAPTTTGTPMPTPTHTPTPTRLPYVIDNILFDEGLVMSLIFNLPGTRIRSKDFEVFHWTSESIKEGIFKPGNDTAITYEDQDRRVVMSVHSGASRMTMHELQVWLEDRGRADSEFANDRIMNELIGSSVDIIAEDETYAFMRVAAAVRVPPPDVKEFNSHVMDLVPYLGLRYPGSGFAQISNRSEVLILYFCGKDFSDETAVPGIDKWSQARFVIAMVSAWERQRKDETQ